MKNLIQTFVALSLIALPSIGAADVLRELLNETPVIIVDTTHPDWKYAVEDAEDYFADLGFKESPIIVPLALTPDDPPDGKKKKKTEAEKAAEKLKKQEQKKADQIVKDAENLKKAKQKAADKVVRDAARAEKDAANTVRKAENKKKRKANQAARSTTRTANQEARRADPNYEGVKITGTVGGTLLYNGHGYGLHMPDSLKGAPIPWKTVDIGLGVQNFQVTCNFQLPGTTFGNEDGSFRFSEISLSYQPFANDEDKSKVLQSLCVVAGYEQYVLQRTNQVAAKPGEVFVFRETSPGYLFGARLDFTTLDGDEDGKKDWYNYFRVGVQLTGRTHNTSQPIPMPPFQQTFKEKGITSIKVTISVALPHKKIYQFD